MSDSRDRILKAIREHPLPDASDFGWSGEPIRYEDPIAQFLTMLEAVGGQGRRVATRAAALEQAQQECAAVKRWGSFASDLPSEGLGAGVDWSAVAQPHELADLDLLVADAEFAIAENGSMWVAHHEDRFQAAYFLAERLVMLCPAGDLAHTMHQAYDRISVEEHRFAFFLSGPSKTADIEQSLVIGAQGPRSLLVLLYGA